MRVYKKLKKINTLQLPMLNHTVRLIDKRQHSNKVDVDIL